MALAPRRRLSPYSPAVLSDVGLGFVVIGPEAVVVIGPEAVVVIGPEPARWQASHPTLPDRVEEEIFLLWETGAMHPASFQNQAYKQFMANNKPHWAYRHLRRALEMLDEARSPSSHWALKAPGHMHNLDLVELYFPNCLFVFTHRNVEEMLPSGLYV